MRTFRLLRTEGGEFEDIEPPMIYADVKAIVRGKDVYVRTTNMKVNGDTVIRFMLVDSWKIHP